MNDPKGSIWRKWDLHVHTPASFQWNGNKFRFADNEEKRQLIQQILDSMESSDIAVFGIMDYWTFDGYWLLKEYITSEGIDFSKTIFPGMEIRVTSPTNYRLNFHFILSNRLTRQQLVDFKNTLEIRIGTQKRSLSDESLIELAKSFGNDVAKAHGFNKPISQMTNDELWCFGCQTAEITTDSIENAIDKLPKNSVFVILPYDTNDGVEKLDWESFPQTDSFFLKLADVFESRSSAVRDLIQGLRTDTNEDIFDDFHITIEKPKPVIAGSDAHRTQDYGNFPSDKATWIKADTTWAGLCITVREPNERCFIGEKPSQLKRIITNKTKIIKEISVHKKENSTLDEIWFDNKIAINPGLTAIIGNKGSGKSALVDIIGVLTNSNKDKHFPFLCNTQFKEPKENKAKEFVGKLVWESGSEVKKLLHENHNKTEIQTSNYIPQSYFEIICNELASTKGDSFDQELKTVVFSHVETSEKLDKDSLDDLVNYKTTAIDRKLAILRRKLNNVNLQVIDLENKNTLSHRTEIENLFKAKKLEVDSFDKSKPKPIKKPKPNSAENDISKKIEGLETERKGLETIISEAKSEKAKVTKYLADLKKTKTEIENFMSTFDELKIEVQDILVEVGLSIEDIVSINIDISELSKKITELESNRTTFENQLNPAIETSPVAKKKIIENSLIEINKKLDEPNQKYQKYQEELRQWEENRKSLIGKKNEPDTLSYYESILEELEQTPEKLAKKVKERDDLVKEIHNELVEITNIYSELYNPVQEFISNHPLARGKFNLIFSVSIINSGFLDRFFDWIHQGVSGSFYGKDEGKFLLDSIINKYNFSQVDEVLAFLNEIKTLLEVDNTTHTPVTVTNQLKKNQNLIDFYDFIYSLDYLTPRYILKMGDKELHELSPGEKGALLLIFYLLIDKSDLPLIIDQPEHNLDNETIYDLLVPAIKEAKQRRQIIVVTHNPNIAVVCDADQIICAKIDKLNGYKVDYLTGGIEKREINNRIIEVLEGTRPAFDNRENKYSLSWIDDDNA
jgi:ABC-type lipoprotein export system ATPase subunit